MNLKNLLVLLLVITLAVGLTLGAAFLYFTWQETFSKPPPAAPNDKKIRTEPFFPTGEEETPKPEEPAPPSGAEQDTTTEPESEVNGPTLAPLSKIVSKPVAGFFVLGSGTSTQVIYSDRAAGHLYAIRPSEGINPVRISNTTIPKIYELSGGEAEKEIRVIARYLKNDAVQNFSGRLPYPTADLGVEPAALEGKFLSSQIYSLALAPTQDNLFYLERIGNETRGATANFDDSKKAAVFTSPFNEWQADWPNPDTVALQTRAAFSIPGSLYLLNLKTKIAAPTISGVPGLTTLVSPDLKKIAYSAQSQRELVFGIYDIKERVFGRLPFKTLADKCVWGRGGLNLYCAAPADLPSAAYPDDWYSGEVTLADRFWKIKTENTQTQLIFDPKLAGFSEEIDAANLIVDREESFLLFLNKKDLSLWLLNLKEDF